MMFPSDHEEYPGISFLWYDNKDRWIKIKETSMNKMLNKKGEYKEYIYITDIRKFMHCNSEKAQELFENVKDYELETRQYEMFKNRVPQDLFHEWRTKRR